MPNEIKIILSSILFSASATTSGVLVVKMTGDITNGFITMLAVGTGLLFLKFNTKQ